MAQMDINLTQNVSALCFGDKKDCQNLFKKIENYDSSINKIYLNELELNKYSFRLDTKYYNLDLTLELFPIESDFDCVDSITSKTELLNNIQSIFIVLNERNLSFLTQLDQLVLQLEKLNKSNSCLSILILTDETKYKAIPEIYQNFLKIRLNEEKNLLDEDEESFSDFDELINSILVHSWEGIELKSDKKVLKKFENIDNQIDNEEFDEKNFNLENLMMNLKDIREKSLKLDFDDRKKFAENVTVNFWKSIGGESEEIYGLDETK